MSRLSNWFKRVAAVGELVARVRTEVPKAAPLIDALQADDYQLAWDTFSGFGDVAAVLEKIPATARPYLAVIGPYFMEALDGAVDEDALEAFLIGVGLLPPEAAEAG